MQYMTNRIRKTERNQEVFLMKYIFAFISQRGSRSHSVRATLLQTPLLSFPVLPTTPKLLLPICFKSPPNVPLLPLFSSFFSLHLYHIDWFSFSDFFILPFPNLSHYLISLLHKTRWELIQEAKILSILLVIMKI